MKIIKQFLCWLRLLPLLWVYTTYSQALNRLKNECVERVVVIVKEGLE